MYTIWFWYARNINKLQLDLSQTLATLSNVLFDEASEHRNQFFPMQILRNPPTRYWIKFEQNQTFLFDLSPSPLQFGWIKFAIVGWKGLVYWASQNSYSLWWPHIGYTINLGDVLEILNPPTTFQNSRGPFSLWDIPDTKDRGHSNSVIDERVLHEACFFCYYQIGNLRCVSVYFKF